MAFITTLPIPLCALSTRLLTSLPRAAIAHLSATPSRPMRASVRSVIQASLPAASNVDETSESDSGNDNCMVVAKEEEDADQENIQRTIVEFTGLLMVVFPMISMMGMPAALASDVFPEAAKEAFKSIPASLVHPAVMWTVTATTLYTLWLGYQSSRIRQADPAVRKELVKARVTERHFKTSSTLFAVVSCSTFFGMANTFNRAGKLFPGPHLYTGLGVVALLSIMSAFVPYMQKGKDWARNSHFAAGIVVSSLFLWQAKSGMDIVGKLLKWD